jgi:hypothetical protein
VALNEAEGLGFYDNDRPAKGGTNITYSNVSAPGIPASVQPVAPAPPVPPTPLSR